MSVWNALMFAILVGAVAAVAAYFGKRYGEQRTVQLLNEWKDGYRQAAEDLFAIATQTRAATARASGRPRPGSRHAARPAPASDDVTQDLGRRDAATTVAGINWPVGSLVGADHN
jgi:hypothetical protein